MNLYDKSSWYSINRFSLLIFPYQLTVNDFALIRACTTKKARPINLPAEAWLIMLREINSFCRKVKGNLVQTKAAQVILVALMRRPCICAALRLHMSY